MLLYDAIIYIYIYRERERILSPVKPELGVIPSGQENIREYLDLPGKELNVSIIQSNNFIKKKTTKPITKDYKFISILLRIFDIFKNTKKINRTSSDQLDKKTGVDTWEWEGIEKWEGIEEGWRVISSLSPLPF